MELKTFLKLLLILCLTDFRTVSSVAFSSNSVNFNRNHTIVRLEVGKGSNKTNNDYVSMIKVIASRFSAIELEATYVNVKQVSDVITATATYNKFNRTADKPIVRLWVTVPNIFENVSAGNTTYLDAFRATLATANTIFPSSVEGLIINVTYFLNPDRFNASDQLQNMLERVSVSPYKIAFLISKKISSSKAYMEALTDIVNRTNACCVVADSRDLAYTADNVNSTIEMVQKFMQESMRNVTSLNGTENVRMILRTGYPRVTTPTGGLHQHYADLAQFWLGMSDWAVKKNVTVSFVQAFDGAENSKWSGWWAHSSNVAGESNAYQEKVKVLEDSTKKPEETTVKPEETTVKPEITTQRPSVTTEQPGITTPRPTVTPKQPEVTTQRPSVTTEQAESPTEEVHTEIIDEDSLPTGIPDKLFRDYLDFFKTLENFDFANNPKFSVEFNPPIGNDSQVDAHQALRMVETISQRFKRLTLRSSKKFTLAKLKQVLNIIAERNARSQDRNEQALMIVVILFRPEPDDKTNEWVSQIKAITEEPFGKYIESIQVTFANDVSPTNIRTRQLTAIILRERFKNSSVKVGLELPFSDCKNFKGNMKPLLNFTPLITFRNTTIQEGNVTDVASNIASLQRTFDKCKSKVDKSGHEVEIGINVAWNSTTTKAGKKDFQSFVRFWGEMNIWSRNSSTQVVLTQAFDTSDDSGFGWWEIDKDSGVMREKWKMLIDELPFDGGNWTRRLFPFQISPSIAVESGQESMSASDDQWWYLVYCAAPSGCVIIAVSIVLSALLVARMKRNQRHLSTDEVEAFVNGSKSYGDNLGEDLYIKSRYNGDMNEIPAQNIAFDSVIGSGKFAMVYKATVAERFVAIKVPKRGCPKPEFKLMLIELKIMARAGFHANILAFHGGCTKDIRTGTVYIITEFCENGTLHSYLRTLRYNLEANETAKLESIYDLHKFASEIASGMEYLMEKDVIHGTLCASNVLLGANYVCKVYNFGLNCKLDENGDYIRRNESSFPWQWIALETLKHKIITSKSDVWSYGTTLWEIYSLGRIPFKSGQQEGFLEKLEKGLRLKRPKHATQDVYDNMMQCWSKNPSDRPQFKEQVEYFQMLMKEEDDQAIAV